ncbi:MAG: LamG-like jellyroll fold domain-containing protein [Candidatus Saccharimonadaceae bacterium]
MKWKQTKHSGFTIVELLIVIVVIAILAAITIVAYNGVTQRATTSALQTEVTSALKYVETVKIQGDGNSFPSDLSASSAFTNSSTISYYYDASGNTFCIQSKKGNLVYSATSAAPTVVSGYCSDNGLIGWWKLNGDATDSSTAGNNGTASSTTSATGQNSQAGQALSFTSASNSNISVPSTTALSNDPQTFSLWVYPTSWSSANGSVMISKRTNSVTNGYYIAYVTGSLSLVFDCGASNTPNRWVTPYKPPLNSWTYLVFTCSTGSGVALYVNGTLNSSRNTVDRSAIASSSPLKFGMEPITSAQVWNGSLDDIRIFNRVLAPSEISALYAANAQ